MGPGGWGQTVMQAPRETDASSPGWIPDALGSRQRIHDFNHLAKRWKRIAGKARYEIDPIAVVSGYPILVLSPARPIEGWPWLYVSAGIHGDEAAGTEGLIRWAEERTRVLRGNNCFIAPCLNPWGLVNNSRTCERGRDLNRLFRARRPPPEVAALKGRLRGHTFEVALTLHEDYDARGTYLYELRGALPQWGEDLLALTSKYLPVDSRGTVEGRRSVRGLIRRRVVPADMEFWPEAIYLAEYHAKRTFTLETPSEFDIDRRARVHMTIVDEIAARVWGTARR